jgi:hypothetical protein
MKVAIELKDRAEGDRVKAALEDTVTRAVVNIMGALQPLPPDERRQALAFVATRFETAIEAPQR